MPGPAFTSAEDARLKALARVRTATFSTIAVALNADGFPARSTKSIAARAYRLGVGRPGMYAAPRWTPEMDAIVRDGVARGRGWVAIADELRWPTGGRSPDNVRDRAVRLGLVAEPLNLEPVKVDVRTRDGVDRLLRTLQTVHTAPPANIRPSPFDGERIDWRVLMPVGGCAGPPAAMCVD